MRGCAIKDCNHPTNGALLCLDHQDEALRIIRREADELEQALREHTD